MGGWGVHLWGEWKPHRLLSTSLHTSRPPFIFPAAFAGSPGAKGREVLCSWPLFRVCIMLRRAPSSLKWCRKWGPAHETHAHPLQTAHVCTLVGVRWGTQERRSITLQEYRNPPPITMTSCTGGGGVLGLWGNTCTAQAPCRVLGQPMGRQSILGNPKKKMVHLGGL